MLLLIHLHLAVSVGVLRMMGLIHVLVASLMVLTLQTDLMVVLDIILYIHQAASSAKLGMTGDRVASRLIAREGANSGSIVCDTWYDSGDTLGSL